MTILNRPEEMHVFLEAVVEKAREVGPEKVKLGIKSGADAANKFTRNHGYKNWSELITTLSNNDKLNYAELFLNDADKSTDEFEALGFQIVAVNLSASCVDDPLAVICEGLSGEYLLSHGLVLDC